MNNVHCTFIQLRNMYFSQQNCEEVLKKDCYFSPVLKIENNINLPMNFFASICFPVTFKIFGIFFISGLYGNNYVAFFDS